MVAALLAVLVAAVLGAGGAPACPAPTDGPQFACYLVATR